MILCIYLLTALILDLKFSENAIIGEEGPYKGFSSHMVDVSNYNVNIIRAKTVKSEESFIKSYVSECIECESEIRQHA